MQKARIEAGELNRQADIEQKSKTDDGAGGNKGTWDKFLTGIWVGIQSSGGNEQYTQGQVRADNRYDITMRYKTGVKASMRVNYQGRLFNIRSVVDVGERHIKLVLKCEELQSPGT